MMVAVVVANFREAVSLSFNLITKFLISISSGILYKISFKRLLAKSLKSTLLLVLDVVSFFLLRIKSKFDVVSFKTTFKEPSFRLISDNLMFPNISGSNFTPTVMSVIVDKVSLSFGTTEISFIFMLLKPLNAAAPI